MVNITHTVLLFSPRGSENCFLKLYIRATQHKINTYDEYLTQSDNCVSITKPSNDNALGKLASFPVHLVKAQYPRDDEGPYF